MQEAGEAAEPAAVARPRLQPRKGTTATQRLKQDYLRIVRDPVPFVTAHPQPSNILEWSVSLFSASLSPTPSLPSLTQALRRPRT